MIFFAGRVWAANEAEAVEAISATLAKKGLELAGPARPYPCQVQPRQGLTWYEYYVKVRERGNKWGKSLK